MKVSSNYENNPNSADMKFDSCFSRKKGRKLQYGNSIVSGRSILKFKATVAVA